MANALRQAAARLPTVGQGGLAMTTSANTHMQPANIVRPIKINRRSVSNSGAPRRGSIDGDGAQLSSAFPQVKRGAGEPLTPEKIHRPRAWTHLNARIAFHFRVSITSACQ